MEYQWDFASVLAAWPLLLRGLVSTLFLFAASASTGLFLGLIVGIGRYARNQFIYVPATIFVEIFRNVPVLIQIVWFYFALPIVVAVEISPFVAAWLGISLNTAAFSADIYRGGIQSIEPAQWDAGRALGARYHAIMRRIILPQALKRMLPALTNRAIEAFKMTTLASIIAYHETLHLAKTIATSNFNPMETYTIVAIMFFLSLYPLILATYRLERYLRRHGGGMR